MFNRPRFLTVLVGVFVFLSGFSVVEFFYPPAARAFALNLSHEKLGGMNLSRANLRWANLQWANLSDAVLDGTDLRGADLRYAVGLTREQLAGAQVDELTNLPDYLAAYPNQTSIPSDASPLKLELGQVPRKLKFSPNKLALARDNSTMAVVGDTDEVELWQAEEKGVRELSPLKPLEGNGRSICFHPTDRQKVAVGSDDGAIRLWKIGEDPPYRVLGKAAHEGYVFNLKFDATGQSLVSASQDERGKKTVHVWGVEEDKPDSTVVVQASEGIVDLSPENRLMMIVSTSPPLRAQLRSITNDMLIQNLEGGSGKATVGAFSLDGLLVAVGTKQRDGQYPGGSIFLWRVDDGHVLTGPPSVLTASVVSLAFSPDGQWLASGWSDGSISIWDVSRARRLITFFGHMGEVSSIVFGTDRQVLASVGTDESVRLWQVKAK